MFAFLFNMVIFVMIIVLRARRNEKEFKVKPATSFKYFQYLFKKNNTKFKAEKILFNSTLVPQNVHKTISSIVSDPTI